MGTKRSSCITKEHAIAQLINEEIDRSDINARSRDIEDATQLMDYQGSMPMVMFQETKNINVNVNINIDSTMTPDKLQALFDTINENMI